MSGITRSTNRPAAQDTWPSHAATLVALFLIIGGLITLAGWWLDMPQLTDWKADGISMFPNSAACAILCGVSLLLTNRIGAPARLPAPIVAGAVAILAGLTLLEHLTGANFGVDTMIVSRSWGQNAAAAPMRMGPPASLSFLILSVALILLSGRDRARGAAVALSLAGLGLSTLSLIGHLYVAQQMYTIPSLNGIAFQTASMLFALALGLILSTPDRQPLRTLLEPTAAGTLARRAVPIAIIVSVALGWACVSLQARGIVDNAFGTALRTIIEVVLLVGLLWWAVIMVRTHEEALHASEAEVRRQAAQLAGFLETAAIALHRVGPDGTILWANDAELKTLGYERDEYIGHHIAEFHVDKDVIADILQRLQSGEHVIECPARLRCKDGSVKSVLIDSSVLRDEGHFVHTQCFTRDVTHQVRIEAEREEANRRKDEFLAILAHELRNPLAPVRNAAYILKLKAPPSAELKRPIEMIERQVAQMSRLIDDLLDVSRISRGVLELRLERVRLADVLEAALEASRDEISAKGHSLDVKAPATAVDLYADRDRLVQILCNLLGNAAKYTPPAGHIEMRIEVRGRNLEISISDSGIGIPRDKLADIFDLFTRVDQSLERQGGLGIGLTLVRQLVELHHGCVEARSAGLGRGSEFFVRLPVVAAEVPRAADATMTKPLVERRRILVADDNADAADSLVMLLQIEGHEAFAAYDGEAAVETFDKLRPDVALLDIGMPKMNGYQVAREIRLDPAGKGVYLVALTGWGQQADKRRATEAGFDAHLVKPVSADVLTQLFADLDSPPSAPRKQTQAS